MNISKKLSYGVKEDTPKELLYPKRIILRNYKDPTKVKTFMEIMKNFNIFQYNFKSAKDSDYFFWQYVDDKGEKQWNHIELSCYDDNTEMVYKMFSLLKICETTYTDIDVEVQYDDIRNVIKKIEEV